ncbi:fibronectin type III domain-containing protein [Desulfocastanea catecholica]
MTTLEIEFAFPLPDYTEKQLSGYKLYKEGAEVCATFQPDVTRINCDIPTEQGTFSFTLSACYSDGTESPQSPVFPFTISSSTIPPTPPTAVVSSSASVGDLPITVTFDGSASTTANPPIMSYSWTFGDGSHATGQTVTHTFTEVGTYYTALTVTDKVGLTDKVETPVIVAESTESNETPTADNSTIPPEEDGTVTVSPDENVPAADGIKLEVGEVSIDHEWVKVLFDNTFTDPVVIAGPPTFNGNHPSTVRIRNINTVGFEIRLQEWDYLDGNHVQETINYIVIDKGIHTLDNGSKIEAGSFTGSTTFKQVSLQQPFSITPVILTQVMTENEADAVTGRISTVSQTSFDFRLQEQEATHDTHTTETVGYLAWEPGKGEISGLLYEARNTTRSVNSNWYNLTFQTGFADLPLFIAGMQTYAGGDTAAVRIQNISGTAVQVMIEEEQSLDTEVGHTSEVVGYLSISSQKDAINVPTAESIKLEVGEVSIDHEWVKVLFDNTFTDPVVIAGPPTFNGNHPSTVRIRNINTVGFEIRLQEWDYLDGNHVQETINYIVIDKGIHTLDNGSKIEAGSFTGSTAFNQVSLQQPFSITPVILTQVMTENEADAVTGRISTVSQTSFDFRLQEQEATHATHTTETVGYLAWEPGIGQISGLLYEARNTTRSVSSNWYNLTFQTGFADLPLFIAGMQTYAGSDTAAVRIQKMSGTAVQVMIEEEQSLDTEVGHTSEVVGYLSISTGN